MAIPARLGPLKLDLEDWQADPIVGELQGADGQPIAFVGWLGLISAVERLRGGEGDQPDRAR